MKSMLMAVLAAAVVSALVVGTQAASPGSLPGVMIERVINDPAKPMMGQTWINLTTRQMKFFDGKNVQVVTSTIQSKQ